VRFEVLTVILLKIQVFLDVTLCLWGNSSGPFKGSHFLYHLGNAVQEDPKDEGPVSLWNIRATHPVIQYHIPENLRSFNP